MLKLYVVGSSSPNPEDWSMWDEIALVLAEDETQAKSFSLCGQADNVTEIPLTGKTRLLYQAPSPELWYGEDT